MLKPLKSREPIIEEQDVYRIEIPYVPTLQGSNAEATQKTTLKSTLKSALKGTRKDIVRIILTSAMRHPARTCDN